LPNSADLTPLGLLGSGERCAGCARSLGPEARPGGRAGRRWRTGATLGPTECRNAQESVSAAWAWHLPTAAVTSSCWPQQAAAHKQSACPLDSALCLSLTPICSLSTAKFPVDFLSTGKEGAAGRCADRFPVRSNVREPRLRGGPGRGRVQAAAPQRRCNNLTNLRASLQLSSS
jgi:hypothetical protein